MVSNVVGELLFLICMWKINECESTRTMMYVETGIGCWRRNVIPSLWIGIWNMEYGVAECAVAKFADFQEFVDRAVCVCVC